ncbi:hypothetical protein TNCV_4629881 [Trichonephila clavipes]|nr:hypothetical protein TNCV_4629881 [Trichonephila clavipes]
MDVCKCLVPSLQECTLNSCQATSPLVRLVKGERGGKPLTYPRMFVHPQNCCGTEPKRPVTCMVLKAMANDRRGGHLSCNDAKWSKEFRFCQEHLRQTGTLVIFNTPSKHTTWTLWFFCNMKLLRLEPGDEPATFGLQGKRQNNYAAQPV